MHREGHKAWPTTWPNKLKRIKMRISFIDFHVFRHGWYQGYFIRNECPYSFLNWNKAPNFQITCTEYSIHGLHWGQLQSITHCIVNAVTQSISAVPFHGNSCIKMQLHPEPWESEKIRIYAWQLYTKRTIKFYNTHVIILMQLLAVEPIHKNGRIHVKRWLDEFWLKKIINRFVPELLFNKHVHENSSTYWADHIGTA